MLALPVIGQIVLLCYGGWSVMNGRIDLGTFVAFASFLAMLDRPYPRTGIVFGYRTAHTGVGGARLRAYRHAFSPWKTVLSRLKVRLSGWTWRR
ncbi:ATP-binding protein [Salmonella enterica subsp. enterica]|uniref:ATP-binding protein n=1 Tax=Salmonella enterica I TaxID=59201 RepID=A0A3S5DMK2_SALET|nr:ATP-binding protein [Salmonella enterica subsp. enterica]